MSAKHTFVQGVARTLDLFGEGYRSNASRISGRYSVRITSDKAAMRQDWIAVGKDIRHSMDTVSKDLSLER